MLIIKEQFLLLLYQKKLKMPRLINFTNQTNRSQKGRIKQEELTILKVS